MRIDGGINSVDMDANLTSPILLRYFGFALHSGCARPALSLTRYDLGCTKGVLVHYIIGDTLAVTVLNHNHQKSQHLAIFT